MRAFSIAALFVVVGLFLPGGNVQPARAQSPPDVFYWNPFDYCRAVGTIDHPDGMQVWLGQTPEMVLAVADERRMPPDAPFRRLPPALAWRCMDGLVYTCNWGANLQCYAKVNFDTRPSDAMNDYCTQQLAAGVPGSVSVPIVRAERFRAYRWQCQGGVAVAIGEPVVAADAQGYFKGLWYLVAERTP